VITNCEKLTPTGIVYSLPDDKSQISILLSKNLVLIRVHIYCKLQLTLEIKMQISVYDYTRSSRKLCSRSSFRCLDLHKCQFCCSHDLQFGIHFVDSAPPMNFAMALVNNPANYIGYRYLLYLCQN